MSVVGFQGILTYLRILNENWIVEEKDAWRLETLSKAIYEIDRLYQIEKIQDEMRR